MSKINELRTKRAKAWDKAQAFLTANRDEKGIVVVKLFCNICG